MLYLLTEYYDNGQVREHCNKSTLIGVFETRKLAEEAAERLIVDGKKYVESCNKKFREEYCKKNCEDYQCNFACECNKCLKDFIYTDGSYSYKVKDHLFDITKIYVYSIKEIELNKRIE